MRRLRKPALMGVIAVLLLVLGAVSSGIAVGLPTLSPAFTVGPAHYYAGKQLSFFAGDALLGADISTWSWTFGDGSSSTDPFGTDHVYATAGTYLATLKVTMSNGAVASTTRALQVEANTPPVARILIAPLLVEANEDLNIAAVESTDREDAFYEQDLIAHWDIGGPTSLSVDSLNVDTRLDAGNYTIKLTVTDAAGASDVAMTTLSVLPAGSLTGSAPSALFTHDNDSPNAGQAESFDATGSADPDGTPLSYAWDFGDGATGTGATASHVFAHVGSYAVVLTVTDGSGRSASVWEWVHVSGPDASFSFTPVAPAAGSPALFDGGGSTDGGNDIANFAWVFGDGSTGTGASLDHTYAAAGQYTARLTVTNAAGQVDSVSHPVVVGPASVTPPTTPTTTGSVTTSPTTTTVAPPSTTTTVVTAPTTTSTTVRPPASAPQAGRHLTGTSRADHLVGGSGPDVIRGRGGNDVIVGGRGRDTLEGGAGNDRINARDGAVDVVRCGTGRDVVIADRVDRVARDCEVVRRR